MRPSVVIPQPPIVQQPQPSLSRPGKNKFLLLLLVFSNLYLNVYRAINGSKISNKSTSGYTDECDTDTTSIRNHRFLLIIF